MEIVVKGDVLNTIVPESGDHPELWYPRVPFPNMVARSVMGRANGRAILGDHWRTVSHSFCGAWLRCHFCDKWDSDREPLQLHEHMIYGNREPRTLYIVGLVPLCDLCHRCIHPGQAQRDGHRLIDLAHHFSRVTSWEPADYLDLVKSARDRYRTNSEIEWSIEAAALEWTRGLSPERIYRVAEDIKFSAR